MGIEIYLDLLYSDANERLSSGNCKKYIPSGNTIGEMFYVALPVKIRYLLLNDFPIVSMLRYQKCMKCYSRGEWRIY